MQRGQCHSLLLHTLLCFASILIIDQVLMVKCLTPQLTTSTRPVLKLNSHGNKNGTFFDDVNNLTMPATIVGIRSLGIGNIYQVDYIQVEYLLSNGSHYKAPTRGDGIFNPEVITLADDEYVARIDGLTNGEMVNQLIITTYRPSVRQPNVYGPYGTDKLNANQSYVFEGNILGFYGTYGKYVLSSLGAYSLAPLKRSKFFGYSNQKAGKNFTDDPDGMFPAAVKINKIFLSYGNQINAIQVEYQLYGGTTKKGPRHGRDKSEDVNQTDHQTVIELSYDEHIIGVRGTIAGGPVNQILQLGFVTVNEKSEVKVYGPFGARCGVESFSLDANVVGIAGSVFKNVITGFQVFYFEN